MHPINAVVKRPALLTSCLVLGLFSVFAAGCDSRKPVTTSGTTQREKELTKEVENLSTKLAAAEQELAQARTRSAAVQEQQSKNMADSQANAGAATNPSPEKENHNKDTRYAVVKKEFTAGQLVPVTSSNPNATERVPAEYRITFKGEQSGKEYPALTVKETAYNDFREGVSYTAADLNQAKLAASASGTANVTSSQPTTTDGRLNDDTSRALFGSPAP